jgi:hypothetical protein
VVVLRYFLKDRLFLMFLESGHELVHDRGPIDNVSSDKNRRALIKAATKCKI